MNPKPEGCGNPRCRNGSILDNAGFWMMICPTCSKPTVEPSPEGVGMPTTEQFAHEFNKLVRMNSASDGLEKALRLALGEMIKVSANPSLEFMVAYKTCEATLAAYRAAKEAK